jgi:hypothetical protein
MRLPVINKLAIRIATVSLALVPQFGVAAEPYAITIEHGVEAKMRDGTILRADIFRPTAPGKFPVILKRTPYDKHNEDAADFGVKGALRGYVVINQDVRGRYTSDGDWYPFLHESNDGYDTVEWAAALPYSNGKGARMGVRMLEQHNAGGHCVRRTSLESSDRDRDNYHDGWTYQAARSSNGSTSHGLPVWRKTRSTGSCRSTPTQGMELGNSLSVTTRFLNYPKVRRMQRGCVRSLRTFSTGWLSPIMTTIGSVGPLRITIRILLYRR